MRTPEGSGNVAQRILFKSKWIIMPFLYGLAIAQTIYCVKFIEELYHLLTNFWSLTESQIMLVMLTLIDIVMIACLIKMIITGSYQSFIESIPEKSTEKISSGLLKVKMATSLIGVSSIHLLRAFISQEFDDKKIYIMIAIHSVFLIGALVLSFIDMLHSKSEYWEAQAEKTS